MTNTQDLLAEDLARRICERIAPLLRESGGKITPRLLSIKEAAEYLGQSPGTIKNMLRDGRLHCNRSGARVLLDLRELDAWIERTRE
jgi:excisionase family DNA binding protein